MLSSAIKAGMTVNVVEQSFRQLMQAYVSWVNMLLVSTLIAAGEKALIDQPDGEYIEADISSYTLVSSFADTKYDIMNEFIMALNTQLQKACGFGATCLLVGTLGAIKLGTNDRAFVKNPTFMQDVDGLVGTYNNIPVVRHRAVDQVSEDGYANVYALFKSADGKAGPIAFGEYTAPVTTDAALNFANPEQYAKSLFSFCGTEIICERLVAVGRLKCAVVD